MIWSNYENHFTSPKPEQTTVGSQLLLKSARKFYYVIVDIDNQEYLDRAIETFGDSPLRTYRDEEIKHLYYISEKPVTSQTQIWGPGTVDVLGTTSIVLPGSFHPSGSRYESNIPLSQWTSAWVQENVPAWTARVKRRRISKKNWTKSPWRNMQLVLSTLNPN